MESNEYNYNKYIDTPEKKKKFETRLNELIKTANEFIEEAGYSDNVECNERIMLNVILDYYADIDRLKQFHDVDLARPTKMVAYTVAWIVRRKPLQFINYSDVVFVEEPTYNGALEVFKSRGAKVISIPMLDEIVRNILIKNIMVN